jgi:hypothetical protein
LQFKSEIVMLVAAMVLFTISTFCYSYAISNGDFAFALTLSFPYRAYAIPIVGFGSVLMATATASYAKRSKNCPKVFPC